MSVISRKCSVCSYVRIVVVLVDIGTLRCLMLFAASAQVVIEVTDANDNAPQLSQRTYTVTVDELMPVGSPVITLAATDLDIGINARMTYTIDSSDDSEFFYADSIYAAGTAVIRIKQVTCRNIYILIKYL